MTESRASLELQVNRSAGLSEVHGLVSLRDFDDLFAEGQQVRLLPRQAADLLMLARDRSPPTFPAHSPIRLILRSLLRM